MDDVRMLVIATTDPYGNPQCPICHTLVSREGEFCGPDHWQHFHEVVAEMEELLDMTYLTLEEQPWYGVHHG